MGVLGEALEAKTQKPSKNIKQKHTHAPKQDVQEGLGSGRSWPRVSSNYIFFVFLCVIFLRGFLGFCNFLLYARSCEEIIVRNSLTEREGERER